MNSRWIDWLAASIFAAVLLLAGIWLLILPATCANNSPVSLTVSAYDPLYHKDHPQLWSVTTNNKQLIDDKNTKIQALKHLPKGKAWHCPESDGSYYELTFCCADGPTAFVKIENSGCRFVNFQDDKHQTIWYAMADDALYVQLRAFRPVNSPNFTKSSP